MNGFERKRCGSSVRAHAGDRPRSGLTVTRLGNTSYLITPPDVWDSATTAAMVETVADLAHERPEVVLDLTDVVEFGAEAARLITHVSALARGAGGRFLVVCSDEHSGGHVVRDVDPSDPGLTASISERLEGRCFV